MDFGACIINDDLLFFDGECELNDFGRASGLLSMRMDKGRCYEIDLHPFQLGNVGGYSG